MFCRYILFRKFIVDLKTRPLDWSQSGGAGPPAYGTSHTVLNKLGPVLNYYFMENFQMLV